MCRVLKTLCFCPAFSIKVIQSVRLHVQLFMQLLQQQQQLQQHLLYGTCCI